MAERKASGSALRTAATRPAASVSRWSRQQRDNMTPRTSLSAPGRHRYISVFRWCVAVLLVTTRACESTVNVSSVVSATSSVYGTDQTVTVAAVSALGEDTNDVGYNQDVSYVNNVSGEDESTASTKSLEESNSSAAPAVSTVAAAARGSLLRVTSATATSTPPLTSVASAVASTGPPTTPPVAAHTSTSAGTASSVSSEGIGDGDEDDEQPLAKIAANISQVGERPAGVRCTRGMQRVRR